MAALLAPPSARPRRAAPRVRGPLTLTLTLTLTLGVGAGAGATLAPQPSLAAPGTGQSEAPRPSVALLPVRYEDALTEADERKLEEVISTAFEHPDLELVRGTKVERSLLDSCPEGYDEACLRAIGRTLEVTHVVEVVVHARERDFDIELRALTVSNSRSPTEVHVECLVCGISEVRDRVAAQAALLRDRLLIATDPGRVIVEGTPQGAKISVDGRRVGQLPFEGELSSGEHELLINARGYYTEFVPVTVVPGTVERVTVNLLSEPMSGRELQRPIGWSLLGAGLLGVATGAGLLAIDNRQHLARCKDPAKRDDQGACGEVYSTLGGGVAVFSIGLSAISVGATLLVVNRQTRKAEAEEAEASGDADPDADSDLDDALDPGLDEPASDGDVSAARWRERAASLRVGIGWGRLQISGRF